VLGCAARALPGAGRIHRAARTQVYICIHIFVCIRPCPLGRRHSPDLTEDDDVAAGTYEYDSDADAAAFGGDER